MNSLAPAGESATDITNAAQIATMCTVAASDSSGGDSGADSSGGDSGAATRRLVSCDGVMDMVITPQPTQPPAADCTNLNGVLTLVLPVDLSNVATEETVTVTLDNTVNVAFSQTGTVEAKEVLRDLEAAAGVAADQDFSQSAVFWTHSLTPAAYTFADLTYTVPAAGHEHQIVETVTVPVTYDNTDNTWAGTTLQGDAAVPLYDAVITQTTTFSIFNIIDNTGDADSLTEDLTTTCTVSIMVKVNLSILDDSGTEIFTTTATTSTDSSSSSGDSSSSSGDSSSGAATRRLDDFEFGQSFAVTSGTQGTTTPGAFGAASFGVDKNADVQIWVDVATGEQVEVSYYNYTQLVNNTYTINVPKWENVDVYRDELHCPTYTEPVTVAPKLYDTYITFSGDFNPSFRTYNNGTCLAGPGGEVNDYSCTAACPWTNSLANSAQGYFLAKIPADDFTQLEYMGCRGLPTTDACSFTTLSTGRMDDEISIYADHDNAAPTSAGGDGSAPYPPSEIAYRVSGKHWTPRVVEDGSRTLR